jgi:hypothetical protein
MVSMTPINRRFCQSLNYPVCRREHIGRNGQVELFRGLEIYHKFKLHRLLHGQAGRFRTFQDFIDENCCPSKVVRIIRCIGYETACLRSRFSRTLKAADTLCQGQQSSLHGDRGPDQKL